MVFIQNHLRCRPWKLVWKRAGTFNKYLAGDWMKHLSITVYHRLTLQGSWLCEITRSNPHRTLIGPNHWWFQHKCITLSLTRWMLTWSCDLMSPAASQGKAFLIEKIAITHWLNQTMFAFLNDVYLCLRILKHSSYLWRYLPKLLPYIVHVPCRNLNSILLNVQVKELVSHQSLYLLVLPLFSCCLHIFVHFLSLHAKVFLVLKGSGTLMFLLACQWHYQS